MEHIIELPLFTEKEVEIIQHLLASECFRMMEFSKIVDKLEYNLDELDAIYLKL